MPPKGTIARDSIQKKEDDNTLTAVIVADHYETRFAPFLSNQGPWCLHRVCNVPIIDFTIDWILRTEINKIILLVSEKNLDYLKPTEVRWRTFFEQFLLISCRDPASIGDALRELDLRAIISSDFLLITNPATFTNATLRRQVENFRARRKANRNNVMTLIYSRSSHPEKATIGVKKADGKLVLYHRADNPSRFDVDKNYFLDDVVIRNNVTDTGIAICSVNVLVQFSTNFDFRGRDDAIREILANEEILLLNIHVDVLNESECATQINDYKSYLTASALLMDRWLYPLCPDNMFQPDEYVFVSNGQNMYYGVEKEKIGSLAGTQSKAILGSCSMVGASCKIEQAVKVVGSVVGDGTTIGLGTRIRNCIIGRNCRIGRGCLLENAIIGDSVTIPNGYQLEKYAILSSNLRMPADPLNRSVAGYALCTFAPDEDDEGLDFDRVDGGFYLWKLSSGYSMWSKEVKLGNGAEDVFSHADSVDENVLTDEESSPETAEAEPVAVFQEEIFDSMTRILELSFTPQLMNNLILEINSSKLANNISMEDVAKYAFKTFILLNACKTFIGFKELALKWKGLFTNYYKPQKSQVQMLMAIEERFGAQNEDFNKALPNMVHFLYTETGLGILEAPAILEWHESLDASSPIRTLMKRIIDWLKEESEEEDDDDE
ncbi:unnamed protein product, partial [Mesorhabditis belari]|uniref:Translation initiation factor eIF2B subunit epsilon n=1 Tax=Mesorhabditis belari TaxID=2138241 RepID=A0AAF3F1X9_9BILA